MNREQHKMKTGARSILMIQKVAKKARVNPSISTGEKISSNSTATLFNNVFSTVAASASEGSGFTHCLSLLICRLKYCWNVSGFSRVIDG